MLTGSGSTLFVVATPIGNREDLSPRARDVLGKVDLIASEDTRRTGRLLSHFGIVATQVSLHEYNEEKTSRTLLVALRDGRSVALVSDAGTPLISDPGFRLLQMAHAEGMTVSPIPGPSAAIAALSVCGLAVDRFCFEGFLPARAAARRARFAALATEARSMVLYEAVHRIRDTLADAAEILGITRLAFIGRELSKMHEQCVQATLGELLGMLDDGRIPAKGEFVLVISGASTAPEVGRIDADLLLEKLLGIVSGKEAVDLVVELCGERRNVVYRKMLAFAGKAPSRDD